jgi:anti-sigma B factor antagonist
MSQQPSMLTRSFVSDCPAPTLPHRFATMTILRIEMDAPARRVRLAGELDMSSAPQLVTTLAETVDRTSDLELDLSELTFMDSSGLHVIINVAKTLDGRATLVLIAPLPAVARVLEIAGIATSIPNVKIIGIPASSNQA